VGVVVVVKILRVKSWKNL